jgi:hypothetical protein
MAQDTQYTTLMYSLGTVYSGAENSSGHRRAAKGLGSGTRPTLVDGGLRDITDRCTLDHVADLEALDGLVLCDAAVAV